MEVGFRQDLSLVDMLMNVILSVVPNFSPRNYPSTKRRYSRCVRLARSSLPSTRNDACRSNSCSRASPVSYTVVDVETLPNCVTDRRYVVHVLIVVEVREVGLSSAPFKRHLAHWAWISHVISHYASRNVTEPQSVLSTAYISSKSLHASP